MAELLEVLQEIALYLRLSLSRVPKTLSDIFVPTDDATLLYSNQTDAPVRVLIQSQGVVGELLLLRHHESAVTGGLVLEDFESVEWVFFPRDRVFGWTTGAGIFVRIFEVGG